jgi:hypothetical protein
MKGKTQMKLQTKKAAIINILIIILLILSAILVIASPALASAAPRCTFNPNHGWHIVGGGDLNDHWFETEEECQAALDPTPEPTEVPTEEPTETPDPTEVPTEEPTETPVVTEVPTEEPTETPVVTEVPAFEPRALNCLAAWKIISGTLHNKDVGYRHFDNPEHAYCQVWLLNRYGIEYDVYKVQHPAR